MRAPKHWYLGWGVWPSQSMFLLSDGVLTSVFSSTLKNITDLLDLETRIFLRQPPKPWSQPILIEILTVLLLFTNTHALSLLTSRHFSLLTCLKCSWVHFDFTSRNFKKRLILQHIFESTPEDCPSGSYNYGITTFLGSYNYGITTYTTDRNRTSLFYKSQKNCQQKKLLHIWSLLEKTSWNVKWKQGGNY